MTRLLRLVDRYASTQFLLIFTATLPLAVALGVAIHGPVHMVVAR